MNFEEFLFLVYSESKLPAHNRFANGVIYSIYIACSNSCRVLLQKAKFDQVSYRLVLSLNSQSSMRT